MINYDIFLNFVNQSSWSEIIYTLLALLGLFLPIAFYFKGKKNKQPIYRTRTINLVKESIDKIKSVDILHHGNKIETLSVSKILIWNTGKETINGTDITKDKFRIEIDEKYKILEYELIFQKKPANDFRLTKTSDNILEINFDYFDYEEGIIVQIYHTATISDSLNVKGSLKGVKNIIRDEPGKRTFIIFNKIDTISDFILDYLFKKRILGLLLFLVPILVIIFMIFAFEIKTLDNLKTIYTIFVNGVFGTIVVLYWFLAYMVTRRRVPKGFDLFEGEF